MRAIPDQHISRVILPVIAAGFSSAALILMGTGLWISSIMFVMIGSFAQIPLFLVGLRHGGLPAAIAGVLSAFLVSSAILSTGSTVNFSKIIINILLWNTFPAAVLTHFALAHQVVEKDYKLWTPAGFLATSLTGLGYVLLFSMSLLSKPFGAEQLERLEDILRQSTAGIPTDQADFLLEKIRLLIPFVPSLQVIAWMLTTLVSGLIAQWLLQKVKKSLRPMPALVDVYIPTSFLFILAVSGLIGYFFFEKSFGQLAANIGIVTLVPYFIMGLGTLRAYTQRASYGSTLLGIACFLMVITPAITVVVAMLGIFEPWLGLRNKLLKQK